MFMRGQIILHFDSQRNILKIQEILQSVQGGLTFLVSLLSSRNAGLNSLFPTILSLWKYLTT